MTVQEVIINLARPRALQIACLPSYTALISL